MMMRMSQGLVKHGTTTPPAKRRFSIRGGSVGSQRDEIPLDQCVILIWLPLKDKENEPTYFSVSVTDAVEAGNTTDHATITLTDLSCATLRSRLVQELATEFEPADFILEYEVENAGERNSSPVTDSRTLAEALNLHRRPGSDIFHLDLVSLLAFPVL